MRKGTTRAPPGREEWEEKFRRQKEMYADNREGGAKEEGKWGTYARRGNPVVVGV